MVMTRYVSSMDTDNLLQWTWLLLDVIHDGDVCGYISCVCSDGHLTSGVVGSFSHVGTVIDEH